jgi:hypothetical protein
LFVSIRSEILKSSKSKISKSPEFDVSAIATKRQQQAVESDQRGEVQGATSAPKGRYQKSFTGFAAAPNTELNDNETDRGSKAGYQSYPVYGKKERSYR